MRTASSSSTTFDPFAKTVSALNQFAQVPESPKEARKEAGRARTLLRVSYGPEGQPFLEAIPEKDVSIFDIDYWICSFFGIGSYNLSRIIQYLESSEFCEKLKGFQTRLSETESFWLSRSLNKLEKKIERHNQGCIFSQINMQSFEMKVTSAFFSIYNQDRVRGSEAQPSIEVTQEKSEVLDRFQLKIESAPPQKVPQIDALRRELREIERAQLKNDVRSYKKQIEFLDELLDSLQASITYETHANRGQSSEKPEKKAEKADSSHGEIHGLVIYQKADGSCLFHSFAECLHRLNYPIFTVHELRELTANLMRQNLSDPKKAVEMKSFILGAIQNHNDQLVRDYKRDRSSTLAGLSLTMKEELLVSAGSYKKNIQAAEKLLQINPRREVDALEALKDLKPDMLGLAIEALEKLKKRLLKIAISVSLAKLNKNEQKEFKAKLTACQKETAGSSLEELLSSIRAKQIGPQDIFQKKLQEVLKQIDDTSRQLTAQHQTFCQKFMPVVTESQENEAIEKYIQSVRSDNTFWGSFPEIKVLREHFQLDVIITYKPQGSNFRLPDHNMQSYADLADPKGTIHLDFSGGSHYNLYLDLPASQAKIWKKNEKK